MEVRWAQSARRHRIGKAHALHVLAHAKPEQFQIPGRGPLLRWVGLDDRGVELEIIAADLDHCLPVIHVMPTGLKRGTAR